MPTHNVSVTLHARADLSNSLGQQLDEVLTWVVPMCGDGYTIAVNVAVSNNAGLFRFSLGHRTGIFAETPVIDDSAEKPADGAELPVDESADAELAKSISNLLCLERKTRLDKKQRSVRERMVSILAREGINTIGELTALSLDELKALPGIGPATYGVLIEKLQKRGLGLRKDS